MHRRIHRRAAKVAPVAQPVYVVGDFEKVGVKPSVPLPAGTPVGLLELTLSVEPAAKEYWFGLPNFYSVMSYNPRVYYAMAVAQLAQELAHAQ